MHRTAIVVAILLASSAGAAAHSTGGRVHHFNLRASTMTVYVYKEGLFSFAADNHEVVAPISAGSLNDETQFVELTVDAKNMRVLDPKMPAGRRATVQSNMLGSQVLDVARYPTIEFRTTRIDRRDSKRWIVFGDLRLHGERHPIEVQASKIDATHFSGVAVIRQTTFGITPIRIAGGTVRVKDDVKVVFNIAMQAR